MDLIRITPKYRIIIGREFSAVAIYLPSFTKVAAGYRDLLNKCYLITQKALFTTPPSTRKAAPVVADASGLAI